MDGEIADREALRREIRGKYRDVAAGPDRSSGFCTGRPLAQRLGYPSSIIDALPGRAVESFAGVNSPFSLRRLKRGEKVVDVGSGAGFDAFIAAGQVGDEGRVVGIDMTPEMVAKSRASADALGLTQVEFRDGLAEALPIEDGWADVVISNGAINSAQTKGRSSRRSTACCGPAERCNSPTSPTGARCRPRLSAISTCGPLESRAGCPVRAGRRCSKTPASPA